MWMKKEEEERGFPRREGEGRYILVPKMGEAVEGLCYNWYWYHWEIRRESVNMTCQETRQTGSSRKKKAALSVKERDGDDAG